MWEEVSQSNNRKTQQKHPHHYKQFQEAEFNNVKLPVFSKKANHVCKPWGKLFVSLLLVSDRDDSMDRKKWRTATTINNKIQTFIN